MCDILWYANITYNVIADVLSHKVKVKAPILRQREKQMHILYVTNISCFYYKAFVSYFKVLSP